VDGDDDILCTDGVTEARDPETDELLGEKRRVRIIETLGDCSCREIHDGILDALAGYVKMDDVTLVVGKRLQG
jgi:serine phosphatase RsbU (regulator of sigma subunit)